jgi:hypothetical protein
MASDRDLSSVLSEFARTPVTDFPIQGILDHLVERIVQIMPITGAGVTLIAEGTLDELRARAGEANSTLEDVFLNLIGADRHEGALEWLE